MPAIHQFHTTLAPGDAVSNHVFALRRLFRSWGYGSFAYAVEAKPGTTDVLPYRRLFRGVEAEDVLLLHYSMGHEVYAQLAKVSARRVLVYHNVTPPEFFEGINPHAALYAERGVRGLAELAPHVDLALAVSEFNREELADAGFARTRVVPVLVDWEQYDAAPDGAVLASWDGPGTRLLFVGRISPNKRQDDLIRMLAYYRRCIDAEAQLILVGAHRDQPQYHGRLGMLASALRLDDAVTFTGSVSLAALIAYYRVASCFVSLSEHEGFGVPLLEAMRFRLPIVAYAAGAIPETVDGAGVLLREKDLAAVAESCALVLERRELRESLVAKGEERLAEYSFANVARRTREALEL